MHLENTLKKHQRYYIQEFIHSFIKTNSQRQWLDLALSCNGDSLSELSAWDFWDDQKVESNKCSEWDSSVQNLKKEPFMKDILSRICITLRLGHDHPSIEEHMLSEILNGEIFIFEGVLIIDPQKLALVFNHDSQIIICRNSLRKNE